MEILIYDARKSKDISLHELSNLTGIGSSTLNRIENKITSPTLDQLELIAIALNTKITALFLSKYK
ncbi:helix-turn-helix domain-containing protein [Zhenpiania hominis]|uniref:Helix-turn-helix transcriptional regulator n=1 Tax=Zhenpiania hominis TaxID=2763644 RepID=A0A923NSQ3_9FIRM|nr:helix-turn-helix transcriptional regulator [Zhenpiania hominis]MBC6681338.1 helix-turn-helix transcriptional regulator [Zhenpiania hominis]